MKTKTTLHESYLQKKRPTVKWASLLKVKIINYFRSLNLSARVAAFTLSVDLYSPP